MTALASSVCTGSTATCPRGQTPEIRIFSVQLKPTELYEDVLRCIDGVVSFPIYLT